MRIIVAGGRDFNDEHLVDKALKYMEQVSGGDMEIVCGMARGADTLGKLWAERHGYPVAKFPADWNRFGKGAGYRRNAEMADYADALIAFWDKQSRGTIHMINLAKKKGLSYGVISYDGKLIEWDMNFKER